MPETGVAADSPRLYVSTELDTWETFTPEPDQDAICERCGFRRLDPEYYAWLRQRMDVAKRARERGRLAAAQYQELRRRFNEVHFWAVKQFGEDALLAAVESLDPEAYQPPAIQDVDPEPPQPKPEPHLYPTEGDWPFTEPVSPEAIAKVDAIRDQALALGWSEAALYQNRGRYRFPVGGDYGMVCFLHDGCEIGDVGGEYIEIVRSSGSKLRHYRPVARSDRPEGRDAQTFNYALGIMNPDPQPISAALPRPGRSPDHVGQLGPVHRS